VPQIATSPGRVLDYGCGDGKFLNRLRARGWKPTESSRQATRHSAGISGWMSFPIVRVDAPELDDAFTGGKRLRLRLLAARSDVPAPLPQRPLAAARRALAGYAAAGQGVSGRLRRWLPARYHAARIEAKMNERFERRCQIGESVTQRVGG
jgi:hypothetical protein